MPLAEIVTIGTEILLGDILDTNSQFIARRLRDLGIDLYRMTSVGDNTQRIANEIQQAVQRSDIILTTGGLGPTVDDPTRQAVALAAGTEVVFHPELWEQILERFSRFHQNPTENNKRQAYLPSGAEAIENPVGTAPAFLMRIQGKVIISLPGVPSEMKYLLEHSVCPFLIGEYQLKGMIKNRILHTVGIGESRIDHLIGDLEALSNPTVGLAAHSGQVDIRVTAKADAETTVNELITRVESEIRSRIGEWIYGVDEETLEGQILKKLYAKEWTLSVVEHGLNGSLNKKMSQAGASSKQEYAGIFLGGCDVQEPQSEPQFLSAVLEEKRLRQSDCCLGINLHYGIEKQDFQIVLITPQGIEESNRSYGGPADYAPLYALHYGLAMLLNF